jgi:hypothetical protein
VSLSSRTKPVIALTFGLDAAGVLGCAVSGIDTNKMMARTIRFTEVLLMGRRAV